MMYTLIGGKRSRSMRVLWLLHEMGLDFEHIQEPPQSPKVRALNPSGKIPVLLVDGITLTDSTAILTYLADKHGQFTFAAGTTDRAIQDSFTQVILDDLDALLWTASRHSFILPEEMRLPAIKDSLKWEFTRNLDRLGARLGQGPFLMGDTMTVPDIILAHCIGWAGGAKFPVQNPAISAHNTMMRGRPAFKAALAD